jgi:hypothetical protein
MAASRSTRPSSFVFAIAASISLRPSTIV